MWESCRVNSRSWDGKSSIYSKSRKIQSVNLSYALFQERLGCGTISPNAKAGARDKTLKYVVRDFENLAQKVVPFCDGRLVVKREALDAFKDVLDRVRGGEHLTARGLLEIVDIAYAMNTKVRRVPRGTIEAAIQRRGILTGHTPDSLE